MNFMGILKALGAAIMAVAIFYVGGMASLEALGYLGKFDWAIKTAAFWTGGVVLALVLAEMTRRIISDIASFLEDEADPPLKFEVDEAHDDPPPAKPAARPAVPPKAGAGAPLKK